MGLFHNGDGSSKEKVPALAAVVKATLEKRHKDQSEWRFIMLVRPDGAAPFGAAFEMKIPDSAGAPDTWHQVPVLFDADEPKTTVELDLSRLSAVDLTVKTAPEVHINGMVFHGGNTLTLPSDCPRCGAAVDLAVQSKVVDPKCPFCGQGLLVAAPNPLSPEPQPNI